VLGIPPKNVQKGVFWPHGSTGSFALNGNHEMYSRGYGYFDTFLPTLDIRNQTTGRNGGQKTSYFSLENSYWRLIHLDTGYKSYSIFLDNKNNTQPDQIIEWLKNVVKIADPSDRRNIIFFSHHQFRSAWEAGYKATAQQLARLLPPGKRVLWLWGHEHRLSFYDGGVFENVTLNHYSRCIGVGGFPTSINKIPKNPRDAKLLAYDNRVYMLEKGTFKVAVGFNGWTRLTLKGPALKIDYYSLMVDDAGKLSNTNSSLLVTETWKADLGSGNIQQATFTIVNKNITIVQHMPSPGSKDGMW
jgi:hypothetical protein